MQRDKQEFCQNSDIRASQNQNLQTQTARSDELARELNAVRLENERLSNSFSLAKQESLSASLTMSHLQEDLRSIRRDLLLSAAQLNECETAKKQLEDTISRLQDQLRVSDREKFRAENLLEQSSEIRSRTDAEFASRALEQRNTKQELVANLLLDNYVCAFFSSSCFLLIKF
jgi:hypothetical protein